jgi:TrmH family RNA methyltransferase
MPVRIVQSKHNARLKELRRALEHPGRDAGLCGLEGPNLVREAVRAGLRIHTAFAAEEGGEALLAELGLSAETEQILTPRAVLEPALVTESPQPVAALVEPPQWQWSHVLAGPAPLVVVLAGVQDPGNLGTILRSAEAFGAQGVISLPGTVSAWNPKAVRASAGSVLRVPLVSAEPTEALEKLRQAGVATLATAVRNAHPATATDLRRAVALIIGNEGNGVPESLAAQADAAITIPCPGPVESLNAAVAASVLLYEAARQRAARGGAE